MPPQRNPDSHVHALGWCADLYAIIKATEKLERAYVRDVVSAQEYESSCEKLIAQFKVLWGSMQVRDRRAARLKHAAPCSAA